MATNPRALIARVIERFAPPTAVVPYQQPGYKPLVPLDAADYLRPKARWPLVWVTDIAGWSKDPITTQVSFSLTHGARYTSESARFQCAIPYDEGQLYDKEGAYIVICLPVENESQVKAILAAASGG